MRIKKVLLLFCSWCMLVGIFTGVTRSVFAYSLLGGRWSSKNISYYYDSWNSTKGKTAFANGVSAWNSSVANITISYSYPNGIAINEGAYPNVTWDGITHASYNSSGIWTSVSVVINTSASSWNDSGALKSVVVHEIGHALGLAHSSAAKSIMNPYTSSRYGTYGLTSPQSDDTKGVNSIYK